MIPTDLDGAFHGIVDRVRKGEIESRIDESVRKILDARFGYLAFAHGVNDAVKGTIQICRYHDHIASGFDGIHGGTSRRAAKFRIIDFRKTLHFQGISKDDPLKSELVPEHAVHNLF